MPTFNPDVQPVEAPDSIRATRPIEQPQANKGLGELFSGIGNVLKEGGELFKDTVKVADYSNKQDIENKGHIGADAQTGERTTLMESLASGVGVDVPGLRKGIMGDERAQADPADIPPDSPLANLKQNAGTLKAARADLSQIDLYYKARALQLSKSLRQEYPGYRDYIDKTIEQEFSGSTPANAYVKSLSDAFIKNQALLQDQNKRDIALSEEGLKKGYVSPELHERVAAGDPTAISEMHRQYYGWSNHVAANEVARNDLSLTEARQKNDREASTRTFSKFGDGIVSHILEDQGLQDFFRDAKADPDNIDETRVQTQGAKLAAAIEDTRNKLRQEAIRKQPWLNEDGSQDTTRPPWSHLSIQSQQGVNSSIDAALKPAQDVLESFTKGKKNFDFASIQSDMITARNHGFGSLLSRDENWGPTMAAISNFKDSPETVREIAKQMVGPDNIKALGKGLQGVTQSYKFRFLSPNPPTPLAAIDSAKEANSPGFNRAIFSTADLMTNPKIDDTAKKNLVTSFFSNKNRGADKEDMFANMSPRQAADHYYKWTTPEYVASVKALGGDAFKQYQDYMSSAFGEQIFKKDINDIGDVDVNFIPGMKIYYNDKTSNFGIQIGDDTEVHLKKNYHLRSDGSQGAAENYLNNFIIPVINRVNGGINGYKNVIDGTPEQTSAGIANALRGAGHDYTAQGTIAGRMWKSLSAYNKAALAKEKEVEEERVKRVGERLRSTDDQR